jgi:broad specificity phosphatase PhoE
VRGGADGRAGRLFLVRHGESEGNRDRVFTRSPEVPLTELGRRQARAAAERVAARWAPVRVVSSPFRRARQTAEIFGEVLGLPVDVEEDLRERCYGALAGQPYAAAREVAGWSPAASRTWCPPGGGETLIEVAARAGAVLDRVARAAPAEDVVVVSHGAVMTALWWHVTGAWRPGRVVGNAGIVVAEHRRGRYLGAALLEDL